MTAAVEHVSTRALRVPLHRPWGPGVTDIRIIEVTVRDTDGAVGRGFSWTPTIGGGAVRALLEEDIAPALLGRPASPEIWDELWAHLHEAGGGGLTTIALAGVDLALWDLRARRANTSVIGLLGRVHERLPVYGSGVNLHYTLEQLVDQAHRWVTAGHRAVKVKVGRPDPAEDLERVAAVREVIGQERRLLVDANQRWDLATASKAIPALAEHGIGWIEEPLRADDLAAHVELRRRVDVPIALGENLHTQYRFAEYLDAGAADVLQPNVIRVGGVTPFLRIAGCIRDGGAVLAAHLLPELSAQLAFALPEQTWIEDVEDASLFRSGALRHPVVDLAEGWVSGGPELGLGFDFA